MAQFVAFGQGTVQRSKEDDIAISGLGAHLHGVRKHSRPAFAVLRKGFHLAPRIAHRPASGGEPFPQRRQQRLAVHALRSARGVEGVEKYEIEVFGEVRNRLVGIRNTHLKPRVLGQIEKEVGCLCDLRNQFNHHLLEFGEGAVQKSGE